MDRVVAKLLRALCKHEFALARARFRRRAHFEVLLGGIGHDFAQKFRKLGSVLRLLIRVTLVSLGDLGIALALRDARHCKVHADLGALAREVGAKPFHHFLVFDDPVADVVLARELRLLNGNKLLRMANGAFHHIIRDDLAANSTSLHKSYLLIFSDCPLQDLCDCIIA